MSLRIRFQYPTGSKLGYSIERLSNGSFYDFSTSTFVASPTTPIATLPEDTGIFAGRFKLTLTPTPSTQFTDGDYVVTVHNQAASSAVVAELAATMHAGDDATVIPQSGSSVVDPWSVTLPGSYAAGSAGAIFGTNLDARISTRSTFAGGAVASVSAPVTVGTVNDKAGYSLAPSGIDPVVIEVGVNARQALSAILASDAGVTSGGGTGTVITKGANTSTTRMVASVDGAGNRTSVTLSLPIGSGISGNSASFVKTDATTQGNWLTSYGVDGYQIANGPVSAPSYASITPSGDTAFTWTSATNDPRALQVPGSSSRLASTYYSATSESFDVRISDGKAHQVSIYALDWEGVSGSSRTETVQLIDDATGAVLDTRMLANFENGIYLSWMVMGDVTIVLTNTGGGGNNAVFSGLFFG
jgi:hypothetical protein